MVDAEAAKIYPTINPYNGETIAMIPQGSAGDAHLAIAAARAAFDKGPWPRMSGAERSEWIAKVANRIKERQKDLARLESMDSGGTIAKTGADAFLAQRQMAFFAEQAKKYNGEAKEIEGLQRAGRAFNYTIREPIGVCAQIIPWNFPLLMAVWKLGPALATGNCLILKPATDTPVSALELAKIFHEVGFPEGVVNVITGPGSVMGKAMTESPLVDKVAFTGSTEVGREIMHKAAGTLKKVTLECGGKSPNIVLHDANWDIAVDGSLFASFYHQGQVCESGTRLLLPRDQHDKFVAEMVAKLDELKLGDPLDPETKVGPVISERQMRAVLDYVEIGKKEGAKLACGGYRVTDGALGKGYFIKPAIFTDVTNRMRIAQEEIFGPVLAVLKYGSEDEAVDIANDSIFGLGGGVWSQDVDRAKRIAQRMRTGTVWINEWHILSERAPFGGYKQSGIGREFGDDGINEYTELKTLYVDDAKTRDNKPWYDMLVPRAKASS
ncbi:MAG: aldehyde dehydrogenase family protein [Alphaproteobacteria bacterium]|nr:aldehyde dehydrogenase family protein [Alphaproteobacteria bacterium]